MRWRIWPISSDARKLPPHVKARLAPYFPGLDLDTVQILDGIPRYVLMNADAYTDRHKIYFAPGKYDAETPEGIALIGHEVTHYWQYRSYGTWRFRAAYGGCWAREMVARRSWEHAYFWNPFEVEARAMEQRIYDDLLEKLCEGDTHGRFSR